MDGATSQPMAKESANGIDAFLDPPPVPESTLTAKPSVGDLHHGMDLTTETVANGHVSENEAPAYSPSDSKPLSIESLNQNDTRMAQKTISAYLHEKSEDFRALSDLRKEADSHRTHSTAIRRTTANNS